MSIHSPMHSPQANRAGRIIFRLTILLTTLLLSQALLARETIRPQPEELGFSTQRLERLSAILDEYVEDGKLPGGVALVARHGQIAYLEAFGMRDREAQAPMIADTIFRIASQSKAVISVGIMILQEEGQLLIADPLGKYLPEFMETTVAVPNEDGGYSVESAKRPITIRDLLTHTAGYGYGMGTARDRWQAAGITGWYFANRDEPIAATVSRMAALPAESHPGERWVYGYNTDILGVVIEKVSGQPLDEFIHDKILKPLQMTDTHFYLPKPKQDRFAVAYSITESGDLERSPNPGHMVGQGAYVDGPRKSFSGGAGLLSTATDYARFLQMLLNGGEQNGQRILSPNTVKLMTANHTGDLFPDLFAKGMGFGLGFALLEDFGARGTPGSFGEYGWGGAYHTTYWVDPEEDLVVVYMTQVLPAGGLDDHAKLRALIYQAIVE